MSLVLVIALLLLTGDIARAHTPVAADRETQLASLFSIIVLLAFWLTYLRGAWRARPNRWPCALFHAALALTIMAILGPLDEWAETNEAAHMSQHMLMMVVIAPLFVLSRPLPQLMAGAGRKAASLWRPVLRLTRYPMISAYIHGAVIWAWHMPYLYVLALEDPWWHVAEHGCFLLSAGLFWWAVLKSARSRAPWALLAVLFTLMHTGFLGALLTFAQAPLYGETRALAAQQLAGLIMWVAGGTPYIAASAWIASRWYRQIVRRTAERSSAIPGSG